MHAVVLGVSADIGRAIAARLLCDGWQVTGLARTPSRVADLPITLRQVDIGDTASVSEVCANLPQWHLFVSCIGTMEPIGPFFDQDFDAWEESVLVNSTGQLRVLHALWPQRAEQPHIMLLAGGGTNNPFPNYSAYCVSKIMLIKMAELIGDEQPSANIFIIGPGFTRTRIHNETLRAGIQAGDGLERTRAFLEYEDGTSLDDIYAHLQWCMAHPEVASGRNFSTVHDPWREGDTLAKQLLNDPDAFRLRRMPTRSVPE